MSQVSFRPITDDDLPFLSRVYAETRQEELAPVPWSDAEKQAFLQMQFEAQHHHYQEHFADAQFDLILINGQPGGRLYVQHRPDEIRIIDLALLIEHRGQGIGTQLMQDVLAQGQERGLPVRIHVEKNNPALRLHQRLGFQSIEDQGVYYLMEWLPEG
jgi:ribosomal protein S18 acetylase RimI-like enzyme